MKSLRWKLGAAFGLVITATLLLSGLSAYLLTTQRFDIFVSDQSQSRTSQLTPFLEASYAYAKDWAALSELLEQSATLRQSPVLAFSPPILSIDNDALLTQSAAVIGVSPEHLQTEIGSGGSIGSIAVAHNVDPEDLIIQLEQAQDLPGPAASGGVTLYSVLDPVQTVQTQIRSFVEYQPSPDWLILVQAQLPAELPELRASLSNPQGFVPLAERFDVEPATLVAAIVDAELTRLKAMSSIPINLILDELPWLVQAAWQFIDPLGRDQPLVNPLISLPPDNLTLQWLQQALLRGDERLIVLDAAGAVAYDSAQQLSPGAALDADLRQQAVPLYDLVTNAQIGAALMVTGPLTYTAQQGAFLRSTGHALLISGAIVGLIVCGLGFLLMRTITAPVLALTQAARRLSAGDWQTQVPIRSNDELGQMSRAFNHMASSLAQQRMLQTRLIHDLTHELHTPLSVIQLEMEGLVDALQAPEEAAAHIDHEVQLMVSLLDDLTWLVRSESKSLNFNQESLDMGQLLAETHERWQQPALNAELQLQLAIPPELPAITGDRTRIVQALGNLLKNAIRHTPPHGCITLECVRIEAQLQLRISDTGEGIAPHDLPHIFERFYRADASRNRDTGGRGLGLAIVRQIIEAHGGSITVASAPGAGSSFTILLPLA